MSTKRRAESRAASRAASLLEPHDEGGASVERVRRRIQQGYYDRPEVRRVLATLILRRAARKALSPR
jgi:hypothetical protein